MIYTKNVSFPYPVYSNDSTEYQEPIFNFEIDNIEVNNDLYEFQFNIELKSTFINSLILNKQAKMIMVFRSNLCFYEELDFNQRTVLINKERLNLNNAQIQLIVVNVQSFNLSDNTVLLPFYDLYKSEIIITKNSLIAYSNPQVYRKPEEDSLKLFSYKIDKTQKEDFRVNLKREVIELLFRDERLMFKNKNRNLLNMYLYNGLSLAIINTFKDEVTESQEINLRHLANDADIDTRTENTLRNKLIDLMLDKGIETISLDNLDEIIYQASDNLIEKFVKEIEKYSFES